MKQKILTWFKINISMDFLDPRKRRSHRLRLIVGYGLITIAIGLATVILVYGAYGYSIDRKTGGIVQNGLLFVDSKPGNTNIYLNGKSINSATAARLILPAADYELILKKTGYRDWKRSFTLYEHSIARFVYPYLFPVKLVTASLKSYASLPVLVTQSPDRRWLLLQNPAATSRVVSFDEFDTSDPRKPARPLLLPSNLLTGGSEGTLTEVEWSADNNHLLIKHDYQGASEFILIDRREPSRSMNLNRVFAFNPTQIQLYDKKVDKLYFYDRSTSTLRLANVREAALEPVLLNRVLAFKPYGTDLISYITDNQMPPGQVSARIWDKQQSHQLTSFPVGDTYLIDAVQFQSNWYYVAGSNTSDRLSIFKNPLNDLKNITVGRARPMTTFLITGAKMVKFSTNTRFLAFQGAQKLVVYDFEESKRYQYNSPSASESPLRWMDGHRLIGVSEGQVLVWDYDATNRQSLVPTLLPTGGYYSSDFNRLYTVATVTGSESKTLQTTEMRAGVDLPANP